jgi:SAM-dependent methyltransferase
MLGRLITKWKIRGIYRTMDYIDAYREHTNLRVDEDPQRAIGGHWEEMGEVQFSFLKQHGLEPFHKMLDIGCGTLRGGRHFIRFLNPGNYTGVDISPKVIEFARGLIESEQLADRKPNLLLNQTGELKFAEFAERFDFLLAQSVFTHLPRKYLEQAFAHVRNVMNPNAVFFFTIWKSDKEERTGQKTFRYPLSLVSDIVEKHGFRLEEFAYSHPTGQSMLAIRNQA